MTGSWKQLIQAKQALSLITTEKIKRIPNLNCTSFEEFQEYTFCQQLRFNFKLLKRVVLDDNHVFLKYWDTTSIDLKDITNEQTELLSDIAK